MQHKTKLKKLQEIINSLEFKDDILNLGGEIYAVGGIVRDAIMEVDSDDLDIVVRGVSYDKLFKILLKYGKPTDTSHVDESGKKDFGSTKFVSKNNEFNKYLQDNEISLDIDIMLPRKDAKDIGVKGHKGIKSDVNHNYTIEDDLMRRDITINAMAMGLSGELISTGTGVDDIKSGIIRAVSKDSFIEDPIRILRAIRFLATYNYGWDDGTLSLIRGNISLLSDKDELPKERFLGEFKKMISKPGLARAVKAIVELGAYESIFGIKSKIIDYSIFDKAKSVGEMSFMMFEKEEIDSILPLIKNNITNDNSIIDYANSLVKYSKLEPITTGLINRTMLAADLYKLSGDALLNSIYISKEFKGLGTSFFNGELPVDERELALKSEELKEFITGQVGGEFNPSKDGIKIGRAKRAALVAIFNLEIKNESEQIKSFLTENKECWIS